MTLSCLPQAHAATCLAPRAFGGPTAATLAPAEMGVPVYPRMATVCARRGSEARPARGVSAPLPPVSSSDAGAPLGFCPCLPSPGELIQGEVGRETPVTAPPVTMPPLPQPASRVATANAACPASATTTLPATLRTGPATVWQDGQAWTALNVRSSLCGSRCACCLPGPGSGQMPPPPTHLSWLSVQ